MSEYSKKPDAEKLAELYEDWNGPPRDRARAFRDRFLAVEAHYLDSVKKEELEAAEVKGRRYLGGQLVSLIRWVGFSGILILIGFLIRFFNAYPGGMP